MKSAHDEAAVATASRKFGSQLRKIVTPRLTPTHFLLASLFSATMVFAQAAKTDVDVADMKETEEGIPVTDKLTIEKCGTCHAPDDKGNLSRISWTRASPEGWAQAMKRMTKLNGMQITADEARAVVKYLATWHGLAPEEAKPVMYMPEHRVFTTEPGIPNEDIRRACTTCHEMGVPMSSRRTKTEWALMQNMHVALFSQADAEFRRPVIDQPAGAPAGAPPLTRGQMGLDWIAKAAPLHTPEWAAWKPRIRSPKLAGTWVVTATVPGKGKYVGQMTINPGKAGDEFTTITSLRSIVDGSTLSRTGQGLVYAGYSWRGSSDGGAKGATPGDLGSKAREALWFSPDQKTAEGRWYWGEYHEFGIDVKLTRAGAEPTVASVAPYALKSGAKGVDLHIFGANLPAGAKPADLDLGAGVTVKKIASASPTEMVVTVDVAADATPGLRDVAVQGSILQKALPIYSKVDYIKVTPDTALARLGGIKFPKGYQQFEAIGFANGADGKARTADDIPLGPIEATWSIDEFSTVFYDDDKSFVGTLSPAALFTPNVEGPNPQRRFGRNNYGEVWVVATAKTEKDAFGKPLTGRSYLVVTVPSYQRRDQPEVSQ